MVELLIVGIVLALIGGAVCGLVAMFRLGELTRRIALLERRVAANDSSPQPSAASPPTPPAPKADTTADELAAARALDQRTDRIDAAAEIPVTAPPLRVARSTSSRTPDRSPGMEARIQAHLRENWMIWLGGFCVALAGIFLAKYSIEQGLLGPTARVTMGIVTGLSLHGAAEWLRRRMREAHPAFAALAGGGSITLFAVLLASMRLYDMLSPTTTFILMAIVALITMWLAYLHGPVLAAIGILGAYLVPVLVSSGEGRVLIALVYALIISASALLLLRYVFRTWLWWGVVVGGLAWWLLSLGNPDADGVRSYYLAAFGYLMLCVPHLDWALRKKVELETEAYRMSMYTGVEPPQERLYSVLFLLLIGAQAISILAEPEVANAFWIWTPLPVLALLAARSRENLNFAPTLLLVGTCIAWLLSRVQASRLHQFEAPEDYQFLMYLVGTAVVYVALGLRNLAVCRFKAIWSSLAVLAPLALVTVGYVLTSRMLVSWQWGASAMMIAIVYLGLASVAVKRSSIDSLVVWLFFGGHFAFSLAAVAVLSEAQLTLAIAVQAISAAWIIDRFKLPQLGWMVKLIVTLVVVRLTLNPWLASYPAAYHWSLWAYGGSTVCAVIATYLLRPTPALSRWTEGAALHLFVLTIWTELRYWLYDGAVFTTEVEFLEYAIYVPLFGVLGIVYYRRSLVSQSLARLYRAFSYLLAGIGLGSYGLMVAMLLGSRTWLVDAIGETPILNLTQLAFGAPVIIGLLYARFFEPRFRRFALAFSGAALFVYVSVQIRHLYQGTVDLTLNTSDAELYTYSVVWLLMAIATILGGAWRLGPACYKAGMALLALVIGKLFFIDLSGLEGLYRVASFMGLGIALLGISYLHQRIQRWNEGAGADT